MFNKAISNKFNNRPIRYSKPFTNAVIGDTKKLKTDKLLRYIRSMKKGSHRV